jgi:hypothetical protein
LAEQGSPAFGPNISCRRRVASIARRCSGHFVVQKRPSLQTLVLLGCKLRTAQFSVHVQLSVVQGCCLNRQRCLGDRDGIDGPRFLVTSSSECRQTRRADRRRLVPPPGATQKRIELVPPLIALNLTVPTFSPVVVSATIRARVQYPGSGYRAFHRYPERRRHKVVKPSHGH